MTGILCLPSLASAGTTSWANRKFEGAANQGERQPMLVAVSNAVRELRLADYLTEEQLSEISGLTPCALRKRRQRKMAPPFVMLRSTVLYGREKALAWVTTAKPKPRPGARYRRIKKTATEHATAITPATHAERNAM
jgi:hypothetical protein